MVEGEVATNVGDAVDVSRPVPRHGDPRGEGGPGVVTSVTVEGKPPARFQNDGPKPDLVILKAARAQAAFEGRNATSDRDIALAAELALPHRIKRGPFQQSEMSMEELQDRIEQLQGQTTTGRETDSEPQDGEGEDRSAEKKI